MKPRNSTYALQSVIERGNILISIAVLDLVGGDYPAAALLTQAVYWTGKGTDWNGEESDWFSKTHAEWKTEIRLSSDQMRRCIKLLKPFGLETCLKGIPAQTFYRVNLECFIDLLAEARTSDSTRWAK